LPTFVDHFFFPAKTEASRLRINYRCFLRDYTDQTPDLKNPHIKKTSNPFVGKQSISSRAIFHAIPTTPRQFDNVGTHLSVDELKMMAVQMSLLLFLNTETVRAASPVSVHKSSNTRFR